MDVQRQTAERGGAEAAEMGKGWGNQSLHQSADSSPYVSEASQQRKKMRRTSSTVDHPFQFPTGIEGRI